MFITYIFLLAPQVVALTLNVTGLGGMCSTTALTLFLIWDAETTTVQENTVDTSMSPSAAKHSTLTMSLTFTSTLSITKYVPLIEKTDMGPIPTETITTVTGPTNTGKMHNLTINIANGLKVPLSVSYQQATYYDASHTVVAPELISMTASTGTFSSQTQVIAPFGWAGRLTIGKADRKLDIWGSKIEGNNGFDGADPDANPLPVIDVSYVDGYTVPIICKAQPNFVTGCDKELFDMGNPCTNLSRDTQVCINEPRNVSGPPLPFFEPCEHQAYTYDYDDKAMMQGSFVKNLVNCCVGSGCSVGQDTSDTLAS